MPKQLLFSVTASDCRWDYFRGTGPGGQKRNKTESGVRCTHVASGAIGQSDETRSQHENKRIAFRKMAESAEFKAWHVMEVARRTGLLKQIEEKVDCMMGDIKTEVFREGRWADLLDDDSNDPLEWRNGY